MHEKGSEGGRLGNNSQIKQDACDCCPVGTGWKQGAGGLKVFPLISREHPPASEGPHFPSASRLQPEGRVPAPGHPPHQPVHRESLRQPSGDSPAALS